MRLVNRLLFGNTASGRGREIWINYFGPPSSNITDFPTFAYTGYSSGGLDSGVSPFRTFPLSELIILKNVYNDNPILGAATDNGGFFPTMKPSVPSAVQDKGIYVKRSGTIVYFSLDKISWYTDFNENGLINPATPPADAEDITNTDATGYVRDGAPDIGAVEWR